MLKNTKDGNSESGTLNDDLEFFGGRLIGNFAMRRMSEKIILIETVDKEGNRYQVTFESKKKIYANVGKK